MTTKKTTLREAFQDRTVELSAAGNEPANGRLVEYFRPSGRAKLLREHGVEIVRDAIVEGRLKPGTRLIERELCEALGVSRTVVREIIRDLEAERLIEVAAHRGPSVATLTPKLLREIYDVRMELEVLFVRSFIACATPEEIQHLHHILDDLKTAAERKDKLALVRIITRFVHYLIAVTDHQVGAEIFDHLLARINMLRIVSMSLPGQIEASIVELSEVVNCIAARDVAGAERMVRAQVAKACASALQQLEMQGG